MRAAQAAIGICHQISLTQRKKQPGEVILEQKETGGGSGRPLLRTCFCGAPFHAREEVLEQEHFRGNAERAAFAKQALTHRWLLLSSFNQVRIHVRDEASLASSGVPPSDQTASLCRREEKEGWKHPSLRHIPCYAPPITFAPDDGGGGGEIKGSYEQFRVLPPRIDFCGF